MSRYRFAVAALLAALCLGCDSSQDQRPPIAATPALNVVQAGAINGNVPNIAYDTQRAYVMVVLPPGGNNDPFCQKVLQTFAGDATIRNSSIVKLHTADQVFCSPERWGHSFIEAEQGYPTVAIMQEFGGQARKVYKMPISPSTNLADELRRVQRAIVEININKPCPNCPQPNPGPAPCPMPNNQPSMPPMANTPNGPNNTDQADDNKAGLILIGVVCALAGGAAYYRG